jgi:hypothetical protein
MRNIRGWYGKTRKFKALKVIFQWRALSRVTSVKQATAEKWTSPISLFPAKMADGCTLPVNLSRVECLIYDYCNDVSEALYYSENDHKRLWRSRSAHRIRLTASTFEMTYPGTASI